MKKIITFVLISFVSVSLLTSYVYADEYSISPLSDFIDIKDATND